MKNLHCPGCGTPFVRVIFREGAIEKLFSLLKVFPFRCQLCTKQFRTYWPESPDATRVVDRRQYKRLPASLHANLFADSAVLMDSRVTDISMDGCTIESTSVLPRGTFLELMFKPTSNMDAIKIETAVVCTTRAESMGIRFLELFANDRHRLSQLVLSLLIGQNIPPTLFP